MEMNYREEVRRIYTKYKDRVDFKRAKADVISMRVLNALISKSHLDDYDSMIQLMYNWYDSETYKSLCSDATDLSSKTYKEFVEQFNLERGA